MATTSAPQLEALQQAGNPSGGVAPPEQFRIEFNAPEIAKFRSAWQPLLQANADLPDQDPSATANPRIARIPWYEHDLRKLSSDDAERWYRNFLQSDRRQLLSASRGRKMRCSAIFFPKGKAELIWSVHPGITPEDRKRMLEEIALRYGQQIPCSEMKSTGAAPPGLPRERQSATCARATESGSREESSPAQSTESPPKDSRLREIESQLLEVWSAVLRVEITKTDEDFFSAGGHSLLAAKLLARIEAATGIELPMASLLDSPTVEKQALLILAARSSAAATRAHAGLTDESPAHAEAPAQDLPEQEQQSPEPLAAEAAPNPRMQTGAARVPVGAETREQHFFLLGGDPTFRPLSQSLAALRRFHSLGLQAGVIATLGPQPSLSQLADYFVSSILVRQPEGPYALGGWCAHGLLSLEVAQQLTARGKRVARLVMLETANPVRLYAYSSWRRMIARRQLKWHLFRFECLYVRHLGWNRAVDYLGARIAKKLHRTPFAGAASGKAESARAAPGRAARINPLEVLYRAAAEYVPQPYDGPVLLVRATQRTIGFAANEELGWDRQWMPRMEVRRVPGNHYTIYMPPNVSSLAKEIDAYVGRADERVR
ncbi:MAG TPA: thioesterase domain-containing protein [Candidatus Acidoferrum sp.]|nr:thioesterase domain-containing protein [Candidatus Acidoferrum sp.]